MQKKFVLDDIKHLLRITEAMLEVAVFSVLIFLFWRHGYNESLFPTYNGRGIFVLMGVYAAQIFVVFYLCDAFKYGYLKLIDVIISQWIAAFIVDFITYFQLCLISNRMVSPWPIVLLFLADAIVAFICSYIFTRIYHLFYVPRNMLLVYGTEDALDLKFKMDSRSDQYFISEIISASEPFEKICKAICQHDAVIINDIPTNLRNDILKYCYSNGTRTYAAPKISDIILSGAKQISLCDTPLRLIKGRGLSLPQRFAKRTFDIMLSLIAMILGIPIMMIIALAIKLEDHGPVFYKQKRVTRNGKVFEILKFRSMIVDAEKGDQVIPATGRDPRITKVGRVIRAARLDEFPQILNILKGDMSIVGPRPERVEHVEKYSKEIPEWHFREKVKGGLTGYAQIIGKYNTSAYDKLRLDLMYIENYSLRLDIKLIFMTVRILFSPESTEGFEKQMEIKEKSKELFEEKA